MFKKIDERLRNRITALEFCGEEKIDVLVKTNDVNTAEKIISKIVDTRDIVCLPIVSALAVKTTILTILKIAKIRCVKFVSSTSKVCSLTYKSKKIIGTDFLKNNHQGTHTCVVIDTGIFPHIDFCLGKNRIIKFVDLINGIDVPYDDNGHGTFVSGVLCSKSIVSKYDGIDNKCQLIVIKALDKNGETTSIKILQAMQWVLDNAEEYNIKVVCMSFGSVLEDRKDPLMYGAEILWNNGIVVVSACGNSGPKSSTIMSPGASRKIITIGSLKVTDGNFEVADFSSRGPAFSYYKPDMLVPGVDIISTSVFDENKEFYTKMSGTSVSTPMVAGVVSLLLNINPNYTPDEIKYMLINSCTKITGDRNAEGYGRLDLSKLKLL